MATGVDNKTNAEDSRLLRMSKKVEELGNKLPHPLYIFLYLLAFIYIASLICSWAGVSLSYTSAAADGTITQKTAKVVNLFSKEQIQKLLVTFVPSYGTPVLLSMMIISMCLGVTEESGFFNASLRKALLGAPRAVATYALCVVGVCANQCGDVGMILTPTLGAVLFQALGRNPWIGIVTGYAAASAGFTANLFPGNTDVLISSISDGVAKGLGYEVNALSNYYFLSSATIFTAAACAYVSETFIVKLFGDTKREMDENALKSFKLTEAENRGLRWAGIGFLALMAIVLLGTVPVDGVFRNKAGQLLPNSPLISSIVVIMGAAFLTLGICYGLGSGSIKSKKEIPMLMAKGVGNMSSLMLILLLANLFATQVAASGISTVVSVGGERLLRTIHLLGFPMLLVFIVVIVFVDLFMYSGSAKWMILAPIFIPMFANLGVHPAMTQLAYRIGDSVANNLTPLNACLLTSVALMEKYRSEGLNKQEPGIGTILSAQVPFSIAFLAAFLIQLAVFYYFKIPIGVNV